MTGTKHVVEVLKETSDRPARLRELLEDTEQFFRRFVVVPEIYSDAIALWIAHTYVYETARATPYAHFWSPDPGSGKTTALEVLEVTVREGKTADDLTGPSLFRLVDALKPTLLFDEVDAVFHAKKASETTADIQKILNSGYRAGKRIYRMGGPQRTDLQEFDPFCPKAMAGLGGLPGTLSHRSIPFGLEPPLPTDAYEDFDPEDVEDEAARLRERWQAWAETAAEALRDPRLKPPKVPELDHRRNEIWRILFRIADLAGGRWVESSRVAAIELCGADAGRSHGASVGIRLLTDIRRVFTVEKMTCEALKDALNALDDSEWGGWTKGEGITTRQLGRRLSPYKIRAKKIRIDERTPNGYEREQFEDAFARYLPSTGSETGTTGTTQSQSQKQAVLKPAQEAGCSGSENPANPPEYRDVPVVPISEPGYADNRPEKLPIIGDEGFLEHLFAAFEEGHVTEGEWREAESVHRAHRALARREEREAA